MKTIDKSQGSSINKAKKTMETFSQAINITRIIKNEEIYTWYKMSTNKTKKNMKQVTWKFSGGFGFIYFFGVFFFFYEKKTLKQQNQQ